MSSVREAAECAVETIGLKKQVMNLITGLTVYLGGEMNTSLYRKKPIHGAVKQCTYPSAPVATR